MNLVTVGLESLFSLKIFFLLQLQIFCIWVQQWYGLVVTSRGRPASVHVWVMTQFVFRFLRWDVEGRDSAVHCFNRSMIIDSRISLIFCFLLVRLTVVVMWWWLIGSGPTGRWRWWGSGETDVCSESVQVGFNVAGAAAAPRLTSVGCK